MANIINLILDIDECLNGQANCAPGEVCVNTIGGFLCDCPPNWKLDQDRHRCVPVVNNNGFPSGYENEPSKFSLIQFF